MRFKITPLAWTILGFVFVPLACSVENHKLRFKKGKLSSDQESIEVETAQSSNSNALGGEAVGNSSPRNKPPAVVIEKTAFLECVSKTGSIQSSIGCFATKGLVLSTADMVSCLPAGAPDLVYTCLQRELYIKGYQFVQSDIDFCKAQGGIGTLGACLSKWDARITQAEADRCNTKAGDSTTIYLCFQKSLYAPGFVPSEAEVRECITQSGVSGLGACLGKWMPGIHQQVVDSCVAQPEVGQDPNKIYVCLQRGKFLPGYKIVVSDVVGCQTINNQQNTWGTCLSALQTNVNQAEVDSCVTFANSTNAALLFDCFARKLLVPGYQVKATDVQECKGAAMDLGNSATCLRKWIPVLVQDDVNRCRTSTMSEDSTFVYRCLQKNQFISGYLVTALDIEKLKTNGNLDSAVVAGMNGLGKWVPTLTSSQVDFCKNDPNIGSDSQKLWTCLQRRVTIPGYEPRSAEISSCLSTELPSGNEAIATCLRPWAPKITASQIQGCRTTIADDSNLAGLTKCLRRRSIVPGYRVESNDLVDCANDPNFGFPKIANCIRKWQPDLLQIHADFCRSSNNDTSDMAIILECLKKQRILPEYLPKKADIQACLDNAACGVPNLAANSLNKWVPFLTQAQVNTCAANQATPTAAALHTCLSALPTWVVPLP